MSGSIIKHPWSLSTGRYLARMMRGFCDLAEKLDRSGRAEREMAVRLENILDNTLDGLLTIDSDGTIEQYNKACERIFGYSAQEAVGENVTILMPESYRNRHDDYLRAYRETGETSILGFNRELEGQRKNGEIFPLDLSVSEVRLRDRIIFSGIVRDITARKRAEEQLIHAQKMEAMGQLSGGIAHDFNNLLTIIFGNTRLLRKLLEEGSTDFSAYEEKVETIRKTAQRGADLVKRMTVFSRQRSFSPETVDINALIEDMRDLLERSLGEMIEIQTFLDEALWSIRIDPVMLEHVLINMAVNARDAMPDGGVLRIETRNAAIDGSDNFAQGSDIAPGDYVVMTVSDTGTGMTQDVRQKIFDPFFTTKEAGKGTGLGLSMAYGFIAEAGGDICVESVPGCGTTFRVYLPGAEAGERRAEADQAAAPDMPRGSETILLVEDEEEICRLAALFLEENGYTVIRAGSGPEALDILLKDGRDIRLLFTDIAMPGEMNGVQLAARAQALKPDLKLLFTTGYADTSIPDMELARQYPVIDKPYAPEVLMKTVRDVLDQG